jgi:carboxyl-terminal processing protease
MQYVVADFTAPDGRRIEARGVVPDVHVPLRRRALLDGRDDALEAALAWIDQRASAAGVASGR